MAHSFSHHEPETGVAPGAILASSALVNVTLGPRLSRMSTTPRAISLLASFEHESEKPAATYRFLSSTYSS
eukprot:671584-Prymnesium_polylepis.1